MTQLQQGAQVFDYRYDPSDYRIGINAGIATRDFYLEGEHLEAAHSWEESGYTAMSIQ